LFQKKLCADTVDARNVQPASSKANRNGSFIKRFSLF
jgi:hypothetical protein